MVGRVPSGSGASPSGTGAADGVSAHSGNAPSRLLDLAARIRAAASREGKPRGDHMAACQGMIAKHFREHWSDDEGAQDMADVADAMDHAIRAETAMVQALTTVGLEAAEVLEMLARRHNAPCDRDAAPRKAVGFEAEGQQPGPQSGIAQSIDPVVRRARHEGGDTLKGERDHA